MSIRFEVIVIFDHIGISETETAKVVSFTRLGSLCSDEGSSEDGSKGSEAKFNHHGCCFICVVVLDYGKKDGGRLLFSIDGLAS